MAKPRKQDGSSEPLLVDLLGSGSAAAWQSFLLRYGPVLMSVAGQHALDADDGQDCFLHICEKLCEDDCRRLRSFDPSRGGTFAAWLYAIASNLCTDWCRARYGRPAVPPAIKSLPALAQQVFELSVLQGLDRETCLLGIRRRYPETTRAELSEALSLVHMTLSSRQRWKYTVFRQRGRVRPPNPDRHAAQPGEADDPLGHTATKDIRARLQRALSRLTARQRLMLRLRYEQEMTLEEVAVVLGLNNLHQARRMIQAALRELAELLPKADFL